MGGMGEFVGYWLCHDKIHRYPPQGSVILLWPYDPSPSRAVSCLPSILYTGVGDHWSSSVTLENHVIPPKSAAPTRPAPPCSDPPGVAPLPTQAMNKDRLLMKVLFYKKKWTQLTNLEKQQQFNVDMKATMSMAIRRRWSRSAMLTLYT